MRKTGNGLIDLSSKQFGVKSPPDLPDTKATVDVIENIVFQGLKDQGFSRHGRTLHRFVSGDISQVINFQSGRPSDGMAGIFCVNLGIRVPECSDRQFNPTEPLKKYYREYECTIRSRLAKNLFGLDVWYSLKESPEKTGDRILKQIRRKVLPVFDVLNSRESILSHRREYPKFDTLNSRLILLEEAMIYGHLGDKSKARSRFQEYYDNCVRKYEHERNHGTKEWMHKGERLVYMDDDGKTYDITAAKSGFVTVYGARHYHIDYLDELAEELGLREKEERSEQRS